MNKLISKIKSFCGHTVEETKKCTWPNKQELIESTAVVIISLAILVVAVAVYDKVFSSIITSLVNG
ncbi:MAG: preprotein translocase subunit SecE [Lentisphaeria bacterium]